MAFKAQAWQLGWEMKMPPDLQIPIELVATLVNLFRNRCDGVKCQLISEQMGLKLILNHQESHDKVKFRALFGDASLQKTGQRADFTLCVYSALAQYL
jgi:hypothetical protein